MTTQSFLNETQKPVEQSREQTGIPAESTHWYRHDGQPCYQVPRAKGDGMRDTTLADARKLNLVPSVSLILKCAAAPGLENWKANEILKVAARYPVEKAPSFEVWCENVMEMSREQGKKAAERGTALHTAIEMDLLGSEIDSAWQEHVDLLHKTCDQHGIVLLDGRPEHSFACGAGYGGKVDWHNDTLLLDFKSKERIDEKVKPYDNHLMQCAAYAYGLGLNRAGNVFIGCEDKQVRVFLYEKEDLEEAFGTFECLLRYWQRKNRFGIYAKKK